MSQEKIDEKMELSQFLYKQVNQWIDNADNKVSISCGIFTGVFGVITFLSEKIPIQDTVNVCWKNIYQWGFVISLALMLGSILCYVLAINPNLGKSGDTKQGKKKAPIFFGDIATLTLDDYRNVMNQATAVDIINELQIETHYNSGICNTKMVRYRRGLWLSFAAVGLAVVIMALRFLILH